MNPEQRVNLDRADDAAERKCIDDVHKYGVHILHVSDVSCGAQPDEACLTEPSGSLTETTAFSYTVGLWHTHGHPEVLIYGLKEDLRHTLLNNLNFEIQRGERFTSGLSSRDVLEGYTCYFEQLPIERHHDHLGWDRWFYEGDSFQAVQMLWPNVHGVYPWSDKASPEFRAMQPVLSSRPLIIS